MTSTAITLDELNALDEQAFVGALDGIYEKAPWVAAVAARSRPFATVSDLHDSLMRAVRQKTGAELLDFLNAHPTLGGREAKAGAVTAESAREQAGLGVVLLPGDEARDARGSERKLSGKVRLSFRYLRAPPYASIDPARLCGSVWRTASNRNAPTHSLRSST